MPNRDGTLKAREFVFFVEDVAMAALPEQVSRPERRVMWTILQLHFGDPNVHFEVQPHMGRRLIELGLHFEGPAETNDQWMSHVGGHAEHILCELGPTWELEEWTASWRRLHRPYAFERLTAALGREVGEELAKAIGVLGPIIESAGIVAPPPAPRAPARRERRRYAHRQ
ncbi:MAG: hypothetical protein ACM3S1_11110 [Hyphomicrobiales bacterium]